MYTFYHDFEEGLNHPRVRACVILISTVSLTMKLLRNLQVVSGGKSACNTCARASVFVYIIPKIFRLHSSTAAHTMRYKLLNLVIDTDNIQQYEWRRKNSLTRNRICTKLR